MIREELVVVVETTDKISSSVIEAMVSRFSSSYKPHLSGR
jgi:hypothetical protein